MFAIHSKIQQFKTGAPLGSYARHYYDLYQLAGQDEVTKMLVTDEYGNIKKVYDSISREHFPTSYHFPEGMSFSKSDALFPARDLRDKIAREYEVQCRVLCYGPYPSWEQVEARFADIRKDL